MLADVSEPLTLSLEPSTLVCVYVCVSCVQSLAPPTWGLGVLRGGSPTLEELPLTIFATSQQPEWKSVDCSIDSITFFLVLQFQLIWV
jgi:hypothetical protein